MTLVGAFLGATAGRADSLAEWIILLAATVTAAGVLHVKVMRPAVAFGVKLVRGVDILLEMPAFRADVHDRLDRLEELAKEPTDQDKAWPRPRAHHR